MRVLRDTAASHTTVRSEAMPELMSMCAGESLVVRGVGGLTVAPMIKVLLAMEGVDKVMHVGMTEDLPMKGCDVLLGDDLLGGVLGTLWKPPGEGEGKGSF